MAFTARESDGTGPVNLKVVSNGCCHHHGPINIRLSFPHPLLVWSGHAESTGGSDGMEREACVCDHGFERSDLCAEIIIIK